MSAADERARFMREAPAPETESGFQVEVGHDDPFDSISLDPLPLHQVAVLEAVLYEQIIEQCRSFRRNLFKIGKDASPDGRPQTCRLISFMRRQRWRDGIARRRRFRFSPPALAMEPLRAPPMPIASLGAPPVSRAVVSAAPRSLQPLPLILLLQTMPRAVLPPMAAAAPPRAKPIAKND